MLLLFNVTFYRIQKTVSLCDLNFVKTKITPLHIAELQLIKPKYISIPFLNQLYFCTSVFKATYD